MKGFKIYCKAHDLFLTFYVFYAFFFAIFIKVLWFTVLSIIEFHTHNFPAPCPLPVSASFYQYLRCPLTSPAPMISSLKCNYFLLCHMFVMALILQFGAHNYLTLPVMISRKLHKTLNQCSNVTMQTTLYVPLFFFPLFGIFSFVMKANCWQPFEFFHFLDFFSITQINERILYFFSSPSYFA